MYLIPSLESLAKWGKYIKN
ncbi:hypothetical protein [Neobacillus sp. PS3-40]